MLLIQEEKYGAEELMTILSMCTSLNTSLPDFAWYTSQVHLLGHNQILKVEEARFREIIPLLYSQWCGQESEAAGIEQQDAYTAALPPPPCYIIISLQFDHRPLVKWAK